MQHDVMPTGDAGSGCVLGVQELNELSGLRAWGRTHVQHLQESRNELTKKNTYSFTSVYAPEGRATRLHRLSS